jgi:Nitroreductase family
MQKETNNKYPIHQILQQRWSPRAFADKKIDKEILQRIFEAARWAPSASNEQPWFFLLGEKEDESYKKIMDCLVEFNQLWAGFAPVLVLTIGRENNTYAYDLGQAVAHLNFQASAEGLHLHQMSGFDPEKAGQLFEIPKGHKAISVIAIGFMGDLKILHPRMQKAELAPRERKEIEEFVYSGKFGEKSNLI